MRLPAISTARTNRPVDKEELLKLTSERNLFTCVATRRWRKKKRKEIDTNLPLDTHRLRINQVTRQHGNYLGKKCVLIIISQYVFLYHQLTLELDITVNRGFHMSQVISQVFASIINPCIISPSFLRMH